MTAHRPPADPIEQLSAAIEAAQGTDPFAPVTVVVPSPYARVQLRREVGALRPLCNLFFRTWSEVVGELARAGLGALVPAGRRAVDESLRQVLSAGAGPWEPLAALARSGPARAELVSLFLELWRADTGLLDALAEGGGRPAALGGAVTAVEKHLAAHGLADPGRVLEAAATGPVDTRATGALLRWFPGPLLGREQPVLEHLLGAGVPTVTIEAPRSDDEVFLPAPRGCGDPEEEVRVTIAAVLEAAAAGVPLWRQAIVHPPSPRYRRIIHQQLALCGLPRAGPSPLLLEQSASGRTLVGLLQLAEGRWTRNGLMRWLDGAPVTTGPNGPRAPVSQWDAISGRAGVVEGLEQWRSRLARFVAGGPADDVHVAHEAAEADAARSLAAFVETLAAELAIQPRRWAEWAEWSRRLLDRYLDPLDRSWPREEAASDEAVREVLADLGALDDLGGGADLATFRHAVERELASRPRRGDRDVAAPSSETGGDELAAPAHQELPGPVGSGLFVGAPGDVRGMGFARVHLVGLADQFVPGVSSATSLLGTGQPADPQWPGPTRRTEELRDDLTAVLALAGAVGATWPVVDPRTGRENSCSRWAAAVPDGRPDISFAADVLFAPPTRGALSAQDHLLRHLATTAGGRPVQDHPSLTAAPIPAGGIPLAESLTAAALAGQDLPHRFDGWIPGAAHRLADRPVSATALEEYATCPRRYLFSRVLRMTPPERPERTEEMEPRERGSLIHEIVAAYVAERLGDGSQPSLGRLLAIASERLEVAAAEGRLGAGVLAPLERSRLMGELRQFFADDHFDPLSGELAFGEPASRRSDPGGPPVDAPAIRLADGRSVRFRGRIDRIDRGPDESLVVSDYKTGRGDDDARELGADPLDHGRRLQLVLYALVAGHLSPGHRVVGRYWFTSVRRVQESVACSVDEPLVERFKDVVKDLLDGLESGAFFGVPGPETYRDRPTFQHCLHCPFDRVCPTDRDRRWAALREAPEAAPLLRLSSDPPPELRGRARKARLDLADWDRG